MSLQASTQWPYEQLLVVCYCSKTKVLICMLAFLFLHFHEVEEDGLYMRCWWGWQRDWMKGDTNSLLWTLRTALIGVEWLQRVEWRIALMILCSNQKHRKGEEKEGLNFHQCFHVFSASGTLLRLDQSYSPSCFWVIFMLSFYLWSTSSVESIKSLHRIQKKTDKQSKKKSKKIIC